MKRLNVVTIQLIRERMVKYDAERLTSAETAAVICRSFIGDIDREVFVVLHLDGKNRVQSVTEISKGSLNQSIVHPREVFKAAILSNSAAVILCHNHPSGDCAPSPEDRECTKRLVDAGEMLGIKVLDHIIIDTAPDGSFFSFAASGIL